MAEVRLSRSARADLAAIDAFSAGLFSDEVADAYSRGFYEVFDLLRRHPSAGATRTDLGDGIRIFAHRQHRICYRQADDAVLIVRILHHAQDARRALKKAAK